MNEVTYSKLESAKKAFDDLSSSGGIEACQAFFKSVSWNFIEAWLDDYSTNLYVADDDDAIKYLDDEFEDGEQVPFESTQDAFDAHVHCYKKLFAEASDSFLNKLFTDEAAKYRVRYVKD